MYIDKHMREAVSYKFGKTQSGQPMVQVCYKGSQIATLAVPTYENDVESAQKHIYAVVRSYIRMMDPSDK